MSGEAPPRLAERLALAEAEGGHWGHPEHHGATVADGGLRGLRIVSADIVEVAPAYDHAEITAIAAAHVGYELLSVMA